MVLPFLGSWTPLRFAESHKLFCPGKCTCAQNLTQFLAPTQPPPIMHSQVPCAKHGNERAGHTLTQGGPEYRTECHTAPPPPPWQRRSFQSPCITLAGEKAFLVCQHATFLEQRLLTVLSWHSFRLQGQETIISICSSYIPRAKRKDEKFLSDQIKGISFFLPLLSCYLETVLQRG